MIGSLYLLGKVTAICLKEPSYGVLLANNAGACMSQVEPSKQISSNKPGNADYTRRV